MVEGLWSALLPSGAEQRRSYSSTACSVRRGGAECPSLAEERWPSPLLSMSSLNGDPRGRPALGSAATVSPQCADPHCFSVAQFLLAVEVLAEANEPDVLNAFDSYCKNENLNAFFQAVDRVGA